MRILKKKIFDEKEEERKKERNLYFLWVNPEGRKKMMMKEYKFYFLFLYEYGYEYDLFFYVHLFFYGFFYRSKITNQKNMYTFSISCINKIKHTYKEREWGEKKKKNKNNKWAKINFRKTYFCSPQTKKEER